MTSFRTSLPQRKGDAGRSQLPLKDTLLFAGEAADSLDTEQPCRGNSVWRRAAV
jgi:hypothetical protein